jgi:DNA modification methylase
MSSSEFNDFLGDAYKCMAHGMKDGAGIYVAHADKEWGAFRSGMIAAGFKLAACLVWVKNQFVLGRSDYQWRHEPILYGWKEGAAHKWYGGRKKTSVMEASRDMPITMLEDGRCQVVLGDKSLLISGDNLQVEEIVGSIVRAAKPPVNKVHPTMKPVGLVIGMIKNSSKRGDKILDLFGGSGSTLIACEKTGRHCRMMELDPVYADVIVRRWQEFTGQRGVRELDGITFDEVAAGV